MEKTKYQTILVEDDDNFAFRRKIAHTQDIQLDKELEQLIFDDISKIWGELGGQDGVCMHLKPLTRVCRDKDLVRVYSLMGGGGVAIICSPCEYCDNFSNIQILTLGEDDCGYFPCSRRVYEEFLGTKEDFVACLAEAISLFNNIKL